MKKTMLRVVGLSLIGLGGIALLPATSRADDTIPQNNYVTTAYVTPSNGVVTYDVQTKTFSPSSIVVGGGYHYGATGIFNGCYQHTGVMYTYTGGAQTISRKLLCNINAPVDDLPNAIPASQIFGTPTITCNSGQPSPASFTGSVTVTINGYAVPFTDPHYGGGQASIKLTANVVNCPPIVVKPSCPNGSTLYNYRDGWGCCGAGTKLLPLAPRD